MAIYSIKDLEKLSGIKAHTIRVWEQRYNLIKPQRTPSNIRYYTDQNLRTILNIALLNKNGLKISKIIEMDEASINQMVADLSSSQDVSDITLDTMTIAMIEMDELKFDGIIRQSIESNGVEATMTNLIQPFLEKISVLWLTGSIKPIQENFISCIIRQKIIAAIDQTPLQIGKQSKKFLIYLPEGEVQELTLLFLHYLLKSKGFHVVYAGMNIGLTDLQDAYTIFRPDFIFTMITETFTRLSVQTYVDRLSNLFPESKILLSGYQIVSQQVNGHHNIVILKSFDETLSFLNKYSKVPKGTSI